MDYYSIQMNASTEPTTSWYDAVNSEFYYEQNQINNMKTNTNGNTFINSVQNEAIVAHSQSTTMITTAEQLHTNIQNHLRPISMHFNNNNNGNYTISSYNDVPDSTYMTYAPCQGERPWNFARCYGFNGEPACPLVNIIDMEDFM